MNAYDAIEAGRSLLDPLFIPAGFAFKHRESGNGSGGPFATASYEKPDRKLEFSFRWGLGCVVYRIGDFSINHNLPMENTKHSRDSQFL
ncbi:MAG: hypothetical protein AAF589_00830, partial [Planctomycetota bacterium]